MLGKWLRGLIIKASEKELKQLREDVDYRIKVALAQGMIPSHMLILPKHILDGFTFTDNSPAAGSIAWSGCHIVYKGTDYTITDGNTANKYIWWDYDATPNTVFQTSNTKPNLTDDDCLVCINADGIHKLVIGATMPHGAFLLGATVDTPELRDSCVATAKLAAGSVLAAKIGDGAVEEAKIAAAAVTAAKIGEGAVTSGKVATAAIIEGKIADGAVVTVKLADGSVTTGKIVDANITAAKLAGGAVTTIKLADGSVIEAKLGTGAVTTGKLADGSVTGAKAAAGAFNASKLNLIEHLLY